MNALRDKALRARREMSSEARAISSEKICRRVLQSREFLSARSVSCYLPMADEVNPLEIIERGWRANKRIFVPVLFGNGKMSFRELRPETTLRRNSYGIWEPETGDYISPRNLNVVLTPTVAYDENNHRIGMGGGYYDRCFSFLRFRKHWLRPKLIGLAFACQKVEKITPNVWDIRLYGLISENH